jgi:glycosyltransferase involved in cell wall biosynthesis
MQPLISILIPAYNSEEWIAQTISSALQQTWPRKEIIVVDDGSSDQTLTIARRFASKTVSVVTQQNQGVCVARNRAFAESQGDYIQWLDADDLLAPDKIEAQIQALDRCASRRPLLSSPWGSFYYRHSRARFVPTSLWCDLSPNEWLLRKLEENLFMQTSVWLVSRPLTEAAGPWDVKLWKDNDGEYFCRVILASDAVPFVPTAKVFYRTAGDTVSYIGRSQKKLDSQFLSIKLHIGYLRSLEDSERSRAACRALLQRSLILFYPERTDIVQEMQLIAATLGAPLEAPRLSFKYECIRRLAGWTAVKEAQLVLPKLRENLNRTWDRALFRLEDSMDTSRLR